MSYTRYTLQSPDVIAILAGVWRSGTGSSGSYYRILPDGRHKACAVRRELVQQLGICPTIATRLLQSADLPTAPFIFNRTKPRPKPLPVFPKIPPVEVEPDVEQCDVATVELPLPAAAEVLAALPIVQPRRRNEQRRELKQPQSRQRQSKRKLKGSKLKKLPYPSGTPWSGRELITESMTKKPAVRFSSTPSKRQESISES